MKIAHSLSAAMTGLVIAVQAATIGIALHFAWGDAQQRAIAAMNVAYTVAESFLHERDRQLATSVDILTRDFALRKAVATGDLPTARSAIGNHAGRVGADQFMLLSPTGQIQLRSSTDIPMNQALWEQIRNAEQQLILLADAEGELYQLVLAPVQAPSTVGWISIGFRVDQELAQQLKQMTGAGIAFVNANETHAFASTQDHGITSDAHLSIGRALPAVGTPVVLKLYEDKIAALSAFFQLRNFTLWVGLFAVALALSMAVLLARRLTSSLSALAATASRVSAGDYRPILRQSGHQEVTDLAIALNGMQHDIAEREQRLEHQATHDALTALPNLNHALRSLDVLLNDACDLVVSVAVVSGLEELNSSVGLDLGDSAVQQLAQAFGDMQAPYVARIADHRFLLAHRNITANAMERLAKQARARLQMLEIAEDVYARLDVQFGSVAVAPEEQDGHSVLRQAWSASLAAQETKTPLAWYDDALAERQVRRLTIMRDLRSAMLDDQLFLLYQPKLDVATGRYSSGEALLRWEHPQLGPVPVDEFIEVAEQTEDINRLSRWVIRTALAQLRRWRAEQPDFQVCVNISPHDLLDPGFTEYVRQALLDHCLPGCALELEVTERAIVEDSDRTLEALQALHDMGVGIALDDYGTGFSSLAQLRKLPADVLKIDKSFVMTLLEDEDNQHIVRSTIDLGHALGMRVVAEGVEDAETLATLARWGCNIMQGYHLSKPVAPDSFQRFLQESYELPAQSEARTG